MKINKNQSKKKLVIVILALVLILAGGYLGVAAITKLPPFVAAEKTYKPGEQVTNLDRSDAEKAAEKAITENPELKTQNNQNDTPAQATTGDSGKATVNVLLTNTGISNGTVSASGFVTDIVEEGGTCTYIFTNGDSQVSKTAQTLINPTSTTCTTVKFPSTELVANGNWSVTLSYSSTTATGKSAAKEFTK